MTDGKKIETVYQEVDLDNFLDKFYFIPTYFSFILYFYRFLFCLNTWF